MSQPRLKILISGAGIAGTVLAYWLIKCNRFDVTIVERAPEMRLSGQEVDIEGPAFSVIRLMNLEAEIRRNGTGEDGFEFINDDGKALLSFSHQVASGELNNQVAIARGSLAKVFCSTIEDEVKIIYGEYVKNAEYKRGKPGKITVEYSNGRPQEDFDLVVAADGLMSKLRGIALNTDPRNHLFPLNAYTAYFTLDIDLLNGSPISKWYNSHSGRVVLLKPCATPGKCFGSVIAVSDNSTEDNKRHLSAIKSGREGFVNFMSERFAGAGWRAKEVIEAMRRSDDLYYTEISQVQTEELYRDRIVFVGDAGYCPTPFTGMGASMAIIGAYILAGNLTSCNSDTDIDSALQKYQEYMIPYVKKGQSLIPGVPRPLIPQTRWGLAIQRAFLRSLALFFGTVHLFRFDKAFGWLLAMLPNSTAKIQIPEFQWGIV